MPVKLRNSKRRAEASALVLALLRDEVPPPGDDDNAIAAMMLLHPDGAGFDGDPTLRDWWRELGEGITKRWAERHRGSRPSSWWKWSAPRWHMPKPRPRWWRDHDNLPEPRARLGG